MRPRSMLAAFAALTVVACGSGPSTSTSTSGAHSTGATGGAGGAQTTSSSGGAGTGGESGVGRFVSFENHCQETIWVGALNNGSTDFVPANGGFELPPGKSQKVTLPEGWGGRFWGRSGCTFDATGKGSCETGDCGGKLECNGSGGKPPASLVEFQLGGFGGKDFYDVSLVDGYNLPIGVAPRPGTFTKSDPNDPYDCGSPACTGDANVACPPELQIKNGAGKVVACASASHACSENNPDPALDCAQMDDLYRCKTGGPNDVQGSCYSPNATASCCGCPSWSPTGACNATNPKWALPAKPEKYAKVFKDACPSAYSFPFDDPTSTFTCKGDDYTITFCP